MLKVNDLLGNKMWNLMACHGTLYLAEKQTFWDDLQFKIKETNGPWVLVGDLNEIIAFEEKRVGRGIWKRILFLKELMLNLRGIDLGFKGRCFIWDNRHDGFGLIK